MLVRNLKSATVAVEANGIKLLADPWLVDGEYYGSWCHYPPFAFDEAYFADVDYIYISHIHPDHFSPRSLALLSTNIPVLIHRYDGLFLKAAIERLGFEVIELEHGEAHELGNGVTLTIYAADDCNPQLCGQYFGCPVTPLRGRGGTTQLDTLSVVSDGVHRVLNVNDCPFELSRTVLSKVLAEHRDIDFLLHGYGGAGPYPQCFVMTDDERRVAAEAKQQSFLANAERYIERVRPRYYMPFAGTYTLAGRLGARDVWRGVPPVEDALAYLAASDAVASSGGHGVVLNSYSYFDLDTGCASDAYVPVDPVARARYIDEVLSARVLDYERDPEPTAEEIRSLIAEAYEHMDAKRRELAVETSTRVLIGIPDGWACVHLDGSGVDFDSTRPTCHDRWVSVELDPRLLVRLLKGPQYAHWNNAEIGSHLTYDRRPQEHEREVYVTLASLHRGAVREAAPSSEPQPLFA